MKKFWMVMRDQEQSYMSKRHETEAEAIIEAERLARKELGHRFFLMKAVSVAYVENQPVTWVPIDF